ELGTVNLSQIEPTAKEKLDDSLLQAIGRSMKYPPFNDVYDEALSRVLNALGREEAIKDLIMKYQEGWDMNKHLGILASVYETERERAEEMLRSVISGKKPAHH
ncbi:MAG: hypothetical protein ACRD3V_26335, partial [Vicinamibacteria bacterium]